MPEPTNASVPTAESSTAIDLCASDELQDGGRAVLFDVLWRGEPQRAFALRHDGQVKAYLNRCAHVPAEMDWNPGEFLDASRRFIICSIHGASYDPQNGRCAGGPCGRGSLVNVTISEEGGRVSWYPSLDIRTPFDS